MNSVAFPFFQIFLLLTVSFFYYSLSYMLLLCRFIIYFILFFSSIFISFFFLFIFQSLSFISFLINMSSHNCHKTLFLSSPFFFFFLLCLYFSSLWELFIVFTFLSSINSHFHPFSSSSTNIRIYHSSFVCLFFSVFIISSTSSFSFFPSNSFYSSSVYLFAPIHSFFLFDYTDT